MHKVYNANIVVYNSETGRFYPDSAITPPEALRTINNFGCIVPPYDKSYLNMLETVDPTHATCLDIKTNVAACLGYGFRNKNPKIIKDIVKRPNRNLFESFNQILKTFCKEYLIFDEAMLEMYELNGKISIFNAPARYMYVQTNVSGRIVAYYYINNNGKSVRFLPYEGGKLKSGVRYIARLKNNNTTSNYYGYPSYLTANGAMLENTLIRRYGIKFFDNNATPNLAVIITGSGLTKEQENNIKEYIRANLKGVDNSHRVLMLNVNEPDAKISLQDLSKSIDGNFLSEFSNNRDEIIRVHQIPPKMMGVNTQSGLSAGSETIGSLKDFQERTVNPIQDELETFFNVLFEEIGGTECEFYFKRLDITNKKDLAVVCQILNKITDANGAPAMTQKETRREFGLPEEVDGTYPPLKQEPEGRQNTHENPDAFDTTRIFYSMKQFIHKMLNIK